MRVRGRDMLKYSIRHRHWPFKLSLVGGSR